MCKIPTRSLLLTCRQYLRAYRQWAPTSHPREMRKTPAETQTHSRFLPRPFLATSPLGWKPHQDLATSRCRALRWGLHAANIWLGDSLLWILRKPATSNFKEDTGTQANPKPKAPAGHGFQGFDSRRGEAERGGRHAPRGQGTAPFHVS